MSLFSEFCKWVNRLEDGTVFTRKELKNEFSDPVDYPTTLDTYRRMVGVAGFIEKTNKRGEYRKVKEIPSELQIKNQMLMVAYPESVRYKELNTWIRDMKKRQAEETELIWFGKL